MPSRDIRRAQSKKKNKKEEHHEEHEHKKIKKPLIYILSLLLLIVIVVTFVGGGIAGSIGNDPSRLIFGYYDDRPIEFRYGNYFSRQTQILADQMRDQDMGATDVTGEAFTVWRQAFERTVVHEGILSLVENAGLTVTDTLIDNRLTEYGPYTDESGNFSEAKYRATSKTEKATTRRLFRGNLKEEIFFTDYFDNHYISESETEFLKSMAASERNFRYVYYSFDEFPEEMVLDYGKENQNLFKKIKLSKITIRSSEADAEAVYQNVIENPEAFSELAQTQSVDSYKDRGGEMDWMMYYQLEPELPSEDELDNLFSLKAEEISDIIANEGSTSTSWTIYKCDSPSIPADFTDQETVNIVRSYMNRYEGGLIEDYLIGEAKKFRIEAEETTFIEAAAELGVPTDITDYFPINYGNSFFLKPVKSMTETDVINGGAYNENFFITAFGLEKEEISDPVILDNNVIVLQLINEREASEEELNQLEMYYPFIVRQNRDEALRDFFLDSDKLEDNFYPVFQQQFLSDS